MSSKWKDNSVQKVKTILKSLASYTVKKSDGEIEYTSLRYNNDIAALVALTKFSPEVPGTQKGRIIRAAIDTARKKDRFLHGAILEEIKREEATYLNRPLNDYVLLTSASIKYHKKLTRIQIQKNYITFHKTCPKSFDRSPIIKRGQNLIQGELPHNYTYVKVSGKARCEYAAAENAFDNLDFLRGIWNFRYNCSKPLRFFAGRPIVLGPVHSLHEKSGKLATNTFWWDSSYRTPQKPLSLEATYEDLKKQERLVRKLIAKANYSPYIRTALIRYVRALDDPDMSSAFLKLWSVLEYITITGKENYETTVRRALSIFKDREYHGIILENLREERNRMVHTGSDSHRSQEILYQLMVYVNNMLEVMIDHGYKFNNTTEFAEFLDRPSTKDELDTSEDELKSSLRSIRLAKRLRGFDSSI